MKIAYLHGLDSNNKKEKNDWLHSNYNSFDPLIDYRKKNIYSKLRDDVKQFSPDAIIGSSMGGYFAFEMGRELNISMLLFNPAIHSRTMQPDMTGHVQGNYMPKLHLVVGRNDELIDALKTIEILKEIGYSDNNFRLLNHEHMTPYDLFTKEIMYFVSEIGSINS